MQGKGARLMKHAATPERQKRHLPWQYHIRKMSNQGVLNGSLPPPPPPPPPPLASGDQSSLKDSSIHLLHEKSIAQARV